MCVQDDSNCSRSQIQPFLDECPFSWACCTYRSVVSLFRFSRVFIKPLSHQLPLSSARGGVCVTCVFASCAVVCRSRGCIWDDSRAWHVSALGEALFDTELAYCRRKRHTFMSYYFGTCGVCGFKD